MSATTAVARRFWRAAAVAGLVAGARDARAQITVSGLPALTVSTAIAGSAPAAATDASTTYSITAPPQPGHYTLMANLDVAMPAGVTLTLNVTANQGTSLGPVALGPVAENVVTMIGKKMNNQVMTYTLSATPDAGVVPLQTRQVTFTIISTP